MLENVIRSQYHATLSMMQQAVEKYPPALWNRSEDKNRTWQVAYHALFYTQLYLQPTLDDFVPWPGHIADAENMDPELLAGEAETEAPYTQEDILDYITFCRGRVDDIVPLLDLEGGSGFHWLPMSKIELQIYSIRHLQTHIGELAERLWTAAGVEIDWVSMGESGQ